MIGFALCVLAFIACYVAARRSLVAGLSAVLAIGYVYGIVRANVPQALSHFIFDAGVAGLYLVHLQRRTSPADAARESTLRPWMLLLAGWPLLLTLLPVQDFLIQLVGLRGHVFLLFFLFFGARLRAEDILSLGRTFVVLNLAVFTVAVAEYFLGVEPFFPRNAVTELIYRSRDVAAYTAYRIPATFTSAHAYAGTMATSLPFLVCLWSDQRASRIARALALVAISVSGIGVFMSGARVHTVVFVCMLLATTLVARMRMSLRMTGLIAVAALGFVVASDERLQRFRTLEDTEGLQGRVYGSVNSTFFDYAARLPMGNGMGGGGTSIPYFLQGRLRDPVGMENEYAHIMLELGIPGLLIWIAFIFWILAGYGAHQDPSLRILRRVGLICVIAYFGTGLIGTGMLTSIPQSALLLLLCGWGVARGDAVPSPAPKRVTGAPRALTYG